MLTEPKSIKNDLVSSAARIEIKRIENFARFLETILQMVVVVINGCRIEMQEAVLISC
jgi:hypothetical protein